MENFLRFCSIISIIIASVKLAIIGHLTPGLIIIIIVSSLLILLANWKIYIITAAFAALILFVKVYGGGSSIGELSLIQSLLILGMVFFGIYIILKGLFKTGEKR
jgi:hypothetical protein